MKKSEIVRRWRKCRLPRLYWKNAHPNWRWDRGEIARTRQGTLVTHYYTRDAILETLAEENCGEK